MSSFLTSILRVNALHSMMMFWFLRCGCFHNVEPIPAMQRVFACLKNIIPFQIYCHSYYLTIISVMRMAWIGRIDSHDFCVDLCEL